MSRDHDDLMSAIVKLEKKVGENQRRLDELTLRVDNLCIAIEELLFSMDSEPPEESGVVDEKTQEGEARGTLFDVESLVLKKGTGSDAN